MTTVFFDLDGVLVNSEIVKHEVIKDFLEINHYPIDHQRFFLFIGAHKSMDTWKEIFDGADPSIDQHKLRNDLRAYRKAKLDDFDYAPYRMEHIVDVLEYLKKHEIKMACASSSSLEYVHTLLKQCAIEQYFDLIVSCDDFKRSKPAPDIYLYCASRLNAEPNDCFVIEDSTYGIAAGKAAGMTVIAKRDHYFGLDQSSADYVIEDMLEIMNIIR